MSDQRRERIESLLAALGPDADAIAATLRSHGIRGRLGSADAGPISWYLGNTMDAFFRTTNQRVAMYVQVADAELPRPIRHFVIRFDLGKYPDLEA